MSDGPDYKPTPKSMPAQPATKQLPAMTDRALLEDLSRVVRTGIAELRADIQLVSSDLSVVKDRVVILEKFKLESEERQTRYSGGARQLSESDSKQDAAIASIIVEQGKARERDEATQALVRENTALTVEFKRRALSVTKHPAVIGLMLAAIAYATHWLAVHT